MFLTLVSTLFTTQIARGIVIYLCFLKDSNLDLVPKVGRFASDIFLCLNYVSTMSMLPPTFL